MIKTLCASLVLAMSLAGCSDQPAPTTTAANPAPATNAAPAAVPDAATLLATVSASIGSDSLATLRIAGSGFDFVLGQSGHPDLPWPRFVNSDYTRQFDFAVPSTRMTRVRSQGENPPRGGGQQPYATQNQNQTLVVSAATPWAQQLQLWMHPHGFIKAAAAREASVARASRDGNDYLVLSFQGDNGAEMKGWINASNQVERIETLLANPMFGDMPYEAVFSDWRDFGGVQHPGRMLELQGGHPVLDLTITDVQANPVVDIVAPQAAGGGGGGAAQGIPVEQLADGVWLILGGYASLVIEFEDHVVVVEGPQSAARGQAVIAEAKRLVPAKPIRYVVNTHHHFDHASGLREFAAEGAVILTHEINIPFYERLYALPRTLEPDSLARAGTSASFEAVGDYRELTDGTQRVELHRMQGNLHNDGLLMVYLPALKLLLQADAYNPPGQPPAGLAEGATPSPYTLNLVENVERLGLDVERIIAVHYPADGRNVTMEEVGRMVGRAQ